MKSPLSEICFFFLTNQSDFKEPKFHAKYSANLSSGNESLN